jgi:hypothetical protein
MRSFLGPPLRHAYYSPSFLLTSQINPSLRSGRSVIKCLQITVIPKDRLAIIPSLRHMIRVAWCNDSSDPWYAQS